MKLAARLFILNEIHDLDLSAAMKGRSHPPTKRALATSQEHLVGYPNQTGTAGSIHGADRTTTGPRPCRYCRTANSVNRAIFAKLSDSPEPQARNSSSLESWPKVISRMTA
jgi:hypothetical protein